MKDKIWIFILIWIAFFSKGLISSDPDFFWHIKVGEIIATSGIPNTDPFSFTMPSYPFVDHEWLTDLVTFKIYPFTSTIGLSFIYASFAVLSLMLVTLKGKWAIIPLILSASLLISFAGIRPQIISWLLVAVILKITLDDKLWQRWRLVLPSIFIIWANLHGGFAVGVGIILLVIITKIWQAERFLLSDFLIFIFSILATLVTPYGVNLWKEVWNSFSDTSLRWSVAEWHPILAYFDLTFLILFALSIFLALKYRAYFDLKLAPVYTILTLMGLSSARNVPFWVLINIPLLSFCFEELFKAVKNHQVKLRRFNIAYKILLVLTVLISAYHITTSFKTDLEWSAEKLYPTKAISFLKQNPPQGEIFALYDWGGYLILNYPEKKVFIDGRMPSWRWNPPSNRESSNAYKEYRDIIFHGKDFTEIFDKYNIQTVLWSAIPGRESKQPKSFTKRLQETGWKKIYGDEVAVIYKRYSLLPPPPKIGDSI